MAMNLGSAYVNVKTDRTGLKSGLTKAENEVGGSVDNMQKRISGLTWAVAVAGVGVFVGAMGKAISAASDLQETTSKFYTVFKNQESAADKFVQTLTGGFAMSTTEARGYLAAIQDLLVPMGMASNDASGLSFEIVKLSADLGSFNNLPTASVMSDIQSALVGNYETMKKYGVVLNATVVQETALGMALAATKGELTAADKAQAAYKLIVEGSTAAIGDMARTSDSYANTLKKHKSTIDDFWAHLGQVALPVAAWGVDQLTTAVEFYADKLGLTMKGFREESETTYTGLIKDAEGYDSYVKQSAENIKKETTAAITEISDNWMDYYDDFEAAADKLEKDHFATIEQMSDNWGEYFFDFVDTADKMEKEHLALVDQMEKDQKAEKDQMSDNWMEFYFDFERVADKLMEENKIVTESITDGWKDGFDSIRNYAGSISEINSGLITDLREGVSDFNKHMVDDFISGTVTMEKTGEYASNAIAASLGSYASKMLDKVFDTIMELIAVNVGLGASEQGAVSAGWGGVWSAIGSITSYIALAGTAILGAKTAMNSWAEGGWVSEHPNGGMITVGSGVVDDVFLGTTPGVNHYGMGGEFVVNKNATAQYRPLLENINAHHADGDYIKPYSYGLKDWRPVADVLALGGGSSFLHGLYKGGPYGGLAEMGLYFGKALGLTFAGKAASDHLWAKGGPIPGGLNVGHGWSIGGVSIPSPGDVIGGVGDTLSDIGGSLSGRVSDFLSGDIAGAFKGAWDDFKTLAEDDWGKFKEIFGDVIDWEYMRKWLLKLIRTPLKQAAKDLRKPGMYYTDATGTMSDILDGGWDLIKEFVEQTTGIHFQNGGVVPQSGNYYLHEGETVNRAGGGQQPILIFVQGDIYAEDMAAKIQRALDQSQARGAGIKYQAQRIDQIGLSI